MDHIIELIHVTHMITLTHRNHFLNIVRWKNDRLLKFDIHI